MDEERRKQPIRAELGTIKQRLQRPGADRPALARRRIALLNDLDRIDSGEDEHGVSAHIATRSQLDTDRAAVGARLAELHQALHGLPQSGPQWTPLKGELKTLEARARDLNRALAREQREQQSVLIRLLLDVAHNARLALEPDDVDEDAAERTSTLLVELDRLAPNWERAWDRPDVTSAVR